MIFLLLSSCSNDSETQSLIEDKLETMSGKEMIRELLIKNDNDIDQLARIFDCSPSSIRRIFHGETIPSTIAKQEFKNILSVTLITKEKTLNQLDPSKKSFSYIIKSFIEKFYIEIILIYFISLMIIVHYRMDKMFDILAAVVALTVLIYLFVVIYVWVSDEPFVVDNFKNTIDPIWELLK